MNNKKIIIAVLCAMLMLIFVACGTNSDDGNASAGKSSPTMTITTQKPTAGTGESGTTEDSQTTPTSDVTPTPTPEPTVAPTPKPTVEPGKETYAGGITSEEAVQYTFVTTGDTNQHRMLNESIAIQFFATVAFNDITVSCPSYNNNIGTLQFDLYPWMGSYEATLANGNEPVATAIFENYVDNADNKISFDTALPDGEYLLYLTTPNAEEQVGVWASTNLQGEPETRLYMDGMEDVGFAIGIKVGYVKTPTVMAGPLTESGLE